jgi:ABC-2 type transport system ATP-binding protein
MAVIQVRDLVKTYRVVQKEPGLGGAVKNLVHRKYKEVRAVDGVSFDVEPGEMVAFLGPNGAGKTTTLKMLSGLIYPTAGTAAVLGYVPWKRDDAFRRSFSLVMGQKNQLWWDLPAGDSFQLHREIYSLPRVNFEKTLGELTELFEVGDLTRQPVRELSLGERMKMELIAALLHEPRLLLLDEPTIGLDVVAQAMIQKCLKQYNASRGVTMLLTSHYMRDVEALCSRCLVITRGRVLFDGPLRKLTERFGTAKLLRVHFEGAATPPDLERFGEVAGRNGPVAELRIERTQIAGVLAAMLDSYSVIDVVVQDPPLESVIARVFEEGSRQLGAAE